MKEKKYEMIEEPFLYGGFKVFRIRALRDFGKVKKGHRGGIVQSENNLSHFGNCWIDVFSRATQNSKVQDNAMLICSEIFGNAEIKNDAVMENCPRLGGDSIICGNDKLGSNKYQIGNSIIDFKFNRHDTREFKNRAFRNKEISPVLPVHVEMVNESKKIYRLLTELADYEHFMSGVSHAICLMDNEEAGFPQIENFSNSELQYYYFSILPNYDSEQVLDYLKNGYDEWRKR